MKRRDYPNRNDGVIKSINKLRQTSNEMRQMYQAIIWLLDQEAQLLDMLENSVILNYQLAEIILQSRQIEDSQKDKKQPAGPRKHRSEHLARNRLELQKKNKSK